MKLALFYSFSLEPCSTNDLTCNCKSCVKVKSFITIFLVSNNASMVVEEEIRNEEN